MGGTKMCAESQSVGKRRDDAYIQAFFAGLADAF
jgi:hypothetical protein